MKRKLILIVVLATALLIVGVVYASQRIGKIKVVVNTVPKNATVFIADKKTKSGTHYVQPGSYTFRAEQAGYADASESYELSQGNETLVIDLLLAPQSEDAVAEAERNADLYLEAEERGAERALARGNAEREKYPILSKLPYTNEAGEYGVGYKLDKDELVITVRGFTSLERQLALGKIESWGYKPSDYRLEFVDFQNPLGERQ